VIYGETLREWASLSLIPLKFLITGKEETDASRIDIKLGNSHVKKQV